MGNTIGIIGLKTYSKMVTLAMVALVTLQVCGFANGQSADQLIVGDVSGSVKGFARQSPKQMETLYRVLFRNAPNAQLYAIDVSFAQLKDKAEQAYLNQLPTSFVLTDEEVDRLRAAAGRIILDSPDFQRLLKDVGARIVDPAAVKPKG